MGDLCLRGPFSSFPSSPLLPVSSHQNDGSSNRMSKVRPRFPELFQLALSENLKDSAGLKNAGLKRKRIESAQRVNKEKDRSESTSHLETSGILDR